MAEHLVGELTKNAKPTMTELRTDPELQVFEDLEVDPVTFVLMRNLTDLEPLEGNMLGDLTAVLGKLTYPLKEFMKVCSGADFVFGPVMSPLGVQKIWYFKGDQAGGAKFFEDWGVPVIYDEVDAATLEA